MLLDHKFSTYLIVTQMKFFDRIIIVSIQSTFGYTTNWDSNGRRSKACVIM